MTNTNNNTTTKNRSRILQVPHNIDATTTYHENVTAVSAVSSSSSDEYRYTGDGDDYSEAVVAAATSYSSAVTEMTMEEVVEHIGFGAFHWKLLFLCGVGYFAEITELVVVSFVAPSIQRQMNLTNVQYGLLGSSSFVGMACGAFFWGYVSDHCGRQLSFALTVWLTFFGGFFSALSPNYVVLLFLRFTAAFGIGGMLPVDYTVFLEFLPQHRRGSYIVLVDAIGVVPALTLSATIAWYFAGADRVEWRGVLLLSSIPVGIMAILRRHVPESPRYHLAAGETAAAQRVVQSVADTNRVRLPEDWRLLSLQESMERERTERTDISSPASKNTSAPPSPTTTTTTTHRQYAPLPNPLRETEITTLPPRIPESLPQPPQHPQNMISYHDTEDGDAVVRYDSHAVETGTPAGHSFDELLRDPALRPTTIRLWCIYFLVQLSSAGMVFALPKLFDETFTGKSERDIALDLLIGVIGLIPGLAIAFVAVERSRTKTLASFLMGAGLSVLCLGWAFLGMHNQFWALFFSIILRGAMEGCFAVLNTTAVESYPTLLRASGLGTAQIFDHISGSLSPLIFSALNANQASKPWVFGLYAVAYIIATIPALGLQEHSSVDY